MREQKFHSLKCSRVLSVLHIFLWENDYVPVYFCHLKLCVHSSWCILNGYFGWSGNLVQTIRRHLKGMITFCGNVIDELVVCETKIEHCLVKYLPNITQTPKYNVQNILVKSPNIKNIFLCTVSTAKQSLNSLNLRAIRIRFQREKNCIDLGVGVTDYGYMTFLVNS